MNKKLSKESLNITQEKIEQLKKIFPEIVSENEVDFERLKLTLGENVQITGERYVLNWANKSDVFTAIQTPTTKTLQPLKEDSVNFDTTQNIFIEGENLEVLKILQKSYFNKIKMIYIDPPYNTGNDSFIYPDKFSESKEEYLKKINEKDEEGYLLKEGLFRKNSKENGQFHSNWLSMMYPRLFLAKNLLKEDGVIFVSIDDNEVHNLRMILNEIFGEENFVGVLKWKRKKQPSFLASHIANIMEYVIVFAKNYDDLESLSIDETSDVTKKVINVSNNYSSRLFAKGVRIKKEDSGIIKKGKYTIKTMDVEYKEDVHYKDGKILNPVEVIARFSCSQTQIDNFIKQDLLFITKNFGLRRDVSKEELGKRKLISDLLLDSWGDNQESEKEIAELFHNKDIFDYTKPTALIKNLAKSVSIENDEIILDFFAGSGTTAQAVMKLNKEDGENRKFILVQLPEKTDEESEAYKAGYKTISEISKERIRRAIKKISNDDDMIKNRKDIDLGFKSYRLKESNFKIWRSDIVSNEEDLKENIDMFEDSLKQNSKNENILTELLLKSGYDLNIKTETIKIDSSNMYIVNDKKLIVCLNKISKQIIDKIIEMKPSKCFILDSLFEGKDSLKTNISLQLEDAKISLTVI